MFVYKVMFGDGSVLEMRANNPKEVNERASKIGIVSFIKWLR